MPASRAFPGSSMLVVATSAIIMVALWLFMGRTLWGQALRAAAVNRFGARLVGIRTETAGALAFTLAALIGAFSGILIGPVTTLYLRFRLPDRAEGICRHGRSPAW